MPVMKLGFSMERQRSSIDHSPEEDDSMANGKANGSGDAVDGIAASRHSVDLISTNTSVRRASSLLKDLLDKVWGSKEPKIDLTSFNNYTGCSQGESGPQDHIDDVPETGPALQCIRSRIVKKPLLSAIACFVIGIIVTAIVMYISIFGLGSYMETVNSNGVVSILDAVALSAVDDVFPDIPGQQSSQDSISSRIFELESQTRGCNARLLQQENVTKRLLKYWSNLEAALLNQMKQLGDEVTEFGQKQSDMTSELKQSLDSLRNMLQQHLPSNTYKWCFPSMIHELSIIFDDTLWYLQTLYFTSFTMLSWFTTWLSPSEVDVVVMILWVMLERLPSFKSWCDDDRDTIDVFLEEPGEIQDEKYDATHFYNQIVWSAILMKKY